MGRHEKLYEHILMRRSDANVPFDGLCELRKRLGFEERVREIATSSRWRGSKKSSTCSPETGRQNRTKSATSGR